MEIVIVSIIGFATLGVVTFQALLLRRQADAQVEVAKSNRLSSLREIFYWHHSPEMRHQREEVASRLPQLLETCRAQSIRLDALGDEGRDMRRKAENILNYYEFIGSLLRHDLVGDEIVDMVHNSTLRFEQLLIANLDVIRGAKTRGPDYASDFRHLASVAAEYRQRQTFQKRVEQYGTGGIEGLPAAHPPKPKQKPGPTKPPPKP